MFTIMLPYTHDATNTTKLVTRSRSGTPWHGDGRRLERSSRRTILSVPPVHLYSLHVAFTFPPRGGRRKGSCHETRSRFAPTHLDRRRCRLRASIAADVFEWKSEHAAEAGAALHGRGDRADIRRLEARDDPSDQSSGRRSERAPHSDRRLGLWSVEHVRRPGADSESRSPREDGPALHALPHHCPVLPDAR